MNLKANFEVLRCYIREVHCNKRVVCNEERESERHCSIKIFSFGLFGSNKFKNNDLLKRFIGVKIGLLLTVV